MNTAEIGAKVDPELEEAVNSYSWSLSHGYARHYARVDGKVKNLFGMHQLVWKLKHGVTVKHLDHINGDRLDNRVTNLKPKARRHSSTLESLRALLDDGEPAVTPVVSVTPDTAVTPALDLEYEERAAIMEYDGGLSRAEAEFEAVSYTHLTLPTKRIV